MKTATRKNRCYGQYRALGGIINKTDYRSILLRARTVNKRDTIQTLQVKTIARYAGIVFRGTKAFDSIIALYHILRTDTKPFGVEHHHSQMCDQRLCAEALRMRGETEALEKLIKAHPRIEF